MKKITGEKELKARYDNAKSFYGKAKVIVAEDGVYLKSYSTIVCSIDKNGSFRRHWRGDKEHPNGYSSTTMRHINEFMRQYGIPESGKKFWDSLEVVGF